MTGRAWFVTGTDTGVGKTRASVALLAALARQGRRAVGMKPVAAGAEPDAQGRWCNDDVLALRAASNVEAPENLVNPYLLTLPASPHLAAQREGVTIELDLLVERFTRLRERSDAVVVEGAGGFFVPLTDTLTGADLAARLQLPVILVVGLRLGCLNHALLTQHAIESHGLRLVGWVANELDPQMLALQDNVRTLQAKLGVPMLAHWTWAPDTPAHTLPIDLGPLDA